MPNLSRQKAALFLVVAAAACYAFFMLATVFFYEKTQLAKNIRGTMALLSNALSADLDDGNYRKYLETISTGKIEFGTTSGVVLKNTIDNTMMTSNSNSYTFICDGKEFEYSGDSLFVCLYPNSSVAVQVNIILHKFIFYKNPLFVALATANVSFLVMFVVIFLFVLKVYLDGLLSYLKNLTFIESEDSVFVPADFKIVSQPIFSLMEKIRILNLQVQDQARLGAMVDISRQVAHDIRSPLSALSIAVKRLADRSEEKDLILSASERIERIANDLLKKTKQKQSLDTENDHFFSLDRVVQQICDEKCLSFSQITWDLETNPEASVLGNKTETARVLSNIVNNAIDAVREKSDPSVSIFLRYYPDFAQVSVFDNGTGIAPELIPHLGTQELSIGKIAGSGLGLYHARKYLESIGGKISINSQLSQGTSVTIFFPINKNA